MSTTPQYRIEEYLAAIRAAYLGESPLPEYPSEPVWRIEQFLAAILSAVKGDSPVMACPDPVWHIEEFARAIYDALVGASPAWPCPTATNNIEAILHAIYKVVADGTETDGIATSWDIEKWLLDSYDAAKQGGGGGTKTTLSGTLPLTLANAISHAIISLTRYGLCTQADTPTPDAPVDIMCNNGALKWDSVNQRVYVDGMPEVLTVSGANLLNPATNITGKYLDGAGKIKDGADAQYTDLIPVTAGETYAWSLVSNRPNGGNDRWHGYDSAGNWVRQIAFNSTGAGLGLPFALTAVIPNGISYVRLSYGIDDTEAMFCHADSSSRISADGYYLGSQGSNTATTNRNAIQSPYTSEHTYHGPAIVFSVLPGRIYVVKANAVTNYTSIIYSCYNNIEDINDASKAVSRGSSTSFRAPNDANYAVVLYVNSASGVTFTFDEPYASEMGVVYSPYVEPQTASVPMLLSVGDVKDEVELISGDYTHRCAACKYDGTQDVGDTYLSTTGGKDIGAIIVYPLATPTIEHITGQNLVTNEGTNIVDSVANVSPVELEATYKKSRH